MSEPPRWTRLHRSRLSRRALLRGSARAGVGAAGLALVGCGGDDEDEAAAQADQADQAEQTDQTEQTDQGDAQAGEQAAQGQQSAAESPEGDGQAGGDEQAQPVPTEGPRPGGIVHLFGVTEDHDRWDPHRSRFRQTQTYFSLIYNRLVRPASVSTGVLEADLADLPETPDASTHIFAIRPEARFWDDDLTAGRAFTAADAAFNIERQQDGLDAAGNPDLLFYRRDDWLRVTGVDVDGERSLTLTTDGPDATLLPSLIAGPWGWMVSPEGAEEFGDRWRDQPDVFQFSSGTGPFIPVGFERSADVSFRRSENWWREGAFPEGVIIRRVPTQTIDASYRSAALDRVDFPLTKNVVESLREDFPDDVQYEIPLDTPVQLQFVVQDDPQTPLGDPRVGWALGLALDRFELIERIYLGEGRPSGPLPWFLEGWALEESDLLTRPGYRPNKEDDLAEVAALLDAAGGLDALGPVEIVVADIFEGVFPGIAQSLQGMLERNTGLVIEPAFRDYGAIREGLAAGTLPAWFGWGAAPRSADPTQHFLTTVHTDGADNFGGYSNEEVDGLIEQMQESLDADERRSLAAQVQDLLLQEPYWIQNVANGIQLGLHKPYLHLDPRSLDFAWAAHHLDTMWIENDHPDYPGDRVLPEAAPRPPRPDAPVGPAPPEEEDAEEPADPSAEDAGADAQSEGN